MLRKSFVLVFVRLRVRARHHMKLQWNYTYVRLLIDIFIQFVFFNVLLF
jgi:hypothetical protein